MNPASALIRMRVASLRNSLFNLKKDAMAKAGVVVFGLGNVLALGYWVSYQSFRFIDGFNAFGDLNAKMIALLFFALLILVVLSTVIINYTTVFVSGETVFLFQNPVPHRAVLFLKLFEAVAFSSWASLFLCLPVLVAYGVLRQAPALYYAEMAAVLVTFLVFAGLVGAALSLALAPLFRRLRPRTLVAGAVAVLAGLTWLFFRSFEFGALEGENNLLVLDRLASGLRAMHSHYSPSRWAAAAILAACDGNHREVLVHGATLLANTLIFLPLISLYGRRLYGREWLARQGAVTSARRRVARGRHSRAPGSGRGAAIGERPISALFAKDVLVFLRNPAQVSQSLLFVLLMVIYSLSLLRIPDFFKDSEQNPALFRFMYFANLAAVCMILSSFTSRFLFPLISLEGRAFWLLGLAPVRREKLLHQKALFGLVLSLALGLATVTISNVALASPPAMFAAAVYTVALAACCLTCLAAGLGAAYPAFHEDNPARIAVGLGGTLNFFASALSVALLLAIEIAPHLLVESVRLGAAARASLVLASHALAAAFAAMLCAFVLRLGGRHLARCEF
jgi:ABC-2 type transport system permease protein